MMANLDGIPNWTSEGRSGGLDPLAMLSSIEVCYQSMMVGFSSVTERFRYYSFFCWWLKEYGRNAPTTSAEDLIQHIRKGEALFALISRQNNNEGGVGGANWAAVTLAEGDHDIDLITGSKQYLENPVYRGVYSTQMEAMDLLTKASEHSMLTLTPDGHELANAFKKEIGDAGPLFSKICQRGILRRGELLKLTAMSVGEIGLLSKEGIILREVLVGRRGKGNRRATLLEILKICRDLKKAPSEYELRWMWLENTPHSDEENYVVLRAWQHFQIADSIRVGYEALLSHCVNRLADIAGGLSPDELAAEVSAVLPPGQTLGEYFIELSAACDGMDYSKIQEAATTGIAPLRDILALIARIWVDWFDSVEEMNVVFPKRAHFRSSADEISFLNDLKDDPVQVAVGKLILDRIVRRHLWVASRKLKNQGNNTYMLEYENGVLMAREKRPINPAGPRTGTAIRFMKEVGLMDENGITNLGLQELQYG